MALGIIGGVAAVIAIEQADVDQWLAGTVNEASELLRLAPVEVFDAGPA